MNVESRLDEADARDLGRGVGVTPAGANDTGRKCGRRTISTVESLRGTGS
jgi:hypothetical protein